MLLWMVGALALAQEVPEPEVPELDTQLFRPSFDSRATLWTETAGDMESDGAAARAFVSYMREPLVFVVDEADERVSLLTDAVALQLLGAYRFDRFRVGVDLPVYLLTTSELAGGGAGTGDLSVDGRATLVDYTTSPVGVALSGRLRLPTSSVDAPLGAAGVGGEIAALATAQLEALQLNANVGQRFLPAAELAGSTFDDELFFMLGGGYAVSDAAGVSAELGGTVNYKALSTNASALPMELLLGGWGRMSDEFVLRGGLGRGLTPGIGSPAARVLVALSYEPVKVRDTDLDGIVDKEDACPTEPEDMDRFEDQDGCPDLDNDQDGVVDTDDDCPLEPEDVDSFDDDDGCPDLSIQVQVRIVDENDQPLEGAQVKVVGRNTELTGVKNLLADLHDGEYTIQGSAEDYLAAERRIRVPLAKQGSEVTVRLVPAARVGTLIVEVLDPDGNHIPEASWFVDDQPGPEIVDGESTLQVMEGEHVVVVRAPGYGPARVPAKVGKDETTRTVVLLQPARVNVTREQITIKDTIYFETAKAVIKEESHPLLREVTQILLDHPEILKVRVEGHTDSRGAASYNQTLSESRAASVLEFLVEQGVERERLESVGYGESKPIDDREVEEAWEKNRRVDFFIVEQEGVDEE